MENVTTLEMYEDLVTGGVEPKSARVQVLTLNKQLEGVARKDDLMRMEKSLTESFQRSEKSMSESVSAISKHVDRIEKHVDRMESFFEKNMTTMWRILKWYSIIVIIPIGTAIVAKLLPNWPWWK